MSGACRWSRSSPPASLRVQGWGIRSEAPQRSSCPLRHRRSSRAADWCGRALSAAAARPCLTQRRRPARRVARQRARASVDRPSTASLPGVPGDPPLRQASASAWWTSAMAMDMAMAMSQASYAPQSSASATAMKRASAMLPASTSSSRSARPEPKVRHSAGLPWSECGCREPVFRLTNWAFSLNCATRQNGRRDWYSGRCLRDRAQMAELVDALGSGPSAGNGVEVRVLFWAPNHKGSRSMRAFFHYSFCPEAEAPARARAEDSKGFACQAKPGSRAA